MSEGRRGQGQDAVYFDHAGTERRDSRNHRSCTGLWRGEVSLGRDGAGKRRWRKVSGRSKTQVYDRLKELRAELDDGVKSSGSYTVQRAADDWLANGMADRAPKTITAVAPDRRPH